MNKLFSSAAVVLSLAAGSAFAAADGPDYNVAAAQASTVTRAEVAAQAIGSHQARNLYGTADGAIDATAATATTSLDRAAVKAETLVALRANHDLVNTPY